jgi:hypothetical protein
VGWDKIVDKSVLMNKLGVDQLIGNQATLALIVNDTNLSKKGQPGFQYWALDDITIGGVTFHKGEFAVRANNGDYFIVDPVNGVSFKAGKLEISALGSIIYGDFTVFDESGGNAQLFLDLLDSSGNVLSAPAITIGSASKKPGITLNGTNIAVNGPLSVGPVGGSYVKISDGMIELYQGGVMKAQMKLAAVAGVLSLLVSGLPLACEGLTSSGDIKVPAVDPNWPTVSNTTLGSYDIFAIAYGGGKFVAVGLIGTSAYSTDGVNWTAVSDSTFGGDIIYAAAYGGDKFVIVGNGGKMAYSTDGINWTQVSDSKFGPMPIGCITYADGNFVAGGNLGHMAYSTDGVNWTPGSDRALDGNNIYGIAYGNGNWAAVGAVGKMGHSTAIFAKLMFNANGSVSWVKG